MSEENILEKVLCVVKELKLKVNEDINKDLLGNENGLYARDLMVLFCEVEKAFDIKITESLFEKYGFRTIKNIVDIVNEALEDKRECSIN